MFKTFIERPVLSGVISILIVIVGCISLYNLPVTLFPEIAPPTVVVTASYPGANAEAIVRAVATPLEEAVNGVENMIYMSSSSNNDGAMRLTVYFKQGTNPDIAAVNVQNRVARVMNQLPQEVIQAGITSQKQQNDVIRYLALYSTDPVYDEIFLENYMRINVFPVLQRVPGVAGVVPFANREYAMRLWLNPERLRAYNLSPQEILAMIRKQNIEAAPGRLGVQSKETFEYTLKFKGKNNRKEAFENMILRSDQNGGLIRLRDVAKVEFGSSIYSISNVQNGKNPYVSVGIVQMSGSNAQNILTELDKVQQNFEKELPPGIKLEPMFDSKIFLDASMKQILETLAEAFILVFLVVFLFLQDLRSTLIPTLAVPVAIIGTFFFMQFFGFSINLLTMFALVLAIGIVIDDAIVVVEAVKERMEGTPLRARQATLLTMGEITAPIISITLVIVAVFIPVSFMQGSTGVFYRQFAFTMTFAVLISGLNALTLSPMLCALLLKNESHDQEGKTKSFGARFFTAFNAGYTSVSKKYIKGIGFTFRNKYLTLGALFLIICSAFLLLVNTKSGFIPAEDKGFVNGIMSVQVGSSLDNTHKIMQQVNALLKDKPYIKHFYTIDGYNTVAGATSSSFGLISIQLKDADHRGEQQDIFKITAKLNEEAKLKIKDANITFLTSPIIPGFGSFSGFELMLQDKSNGSAQSLDQTTQEFIAALGERKEIGKAFTSYSANFPQYEIVVDEEKAARYQVDVSTLMETFQIYFGSTFVTDFNRFGKYYRVVAQADPEHRTNSNSIDQIYVKNTAGKQIAAHELVKLKRVFGPDYITRNNLFLAARINGVPAEGYSSGDAIKAINETAAKMLPRNYTYEWTGLSREEAQTGSQFLLIFIMSLVFVYFILAALYESFILPFAVLLTVPIGILGVMLFINWFNVANNIYIQVSMIMLIGLLAKNAILIVEYALLERRSGKGLAASALKAARLRLRPILMTSFAFIAGLLPLLFARGGFAVGNFSIGIGSIGGMLVGVGLGIFFIPLLFILFQSLQEKWFRKSPNDQNYFSGNEKF